MPLPKKVTICLCTLKKRKKVLLEIKKRNKQSYNQTAFHLKDFTHKLAKNRNEL